ncbi:MAG: RNA polymerase sigma-70 factor [Tannerellaceae bacterium]|jgi:RNA polymerase sigma-70 factor (ECF subfamily)|nr:RNA polymerase sigma-70 factor [Tannerellaceae bacterium]
MKSSAQEEDWDFEKLYLSYFSKMKSFAQEYVPSKQDAEDIVHDVFVNLWEKKRTFTHHAELMAYLFTSVKNRSLNYLRHKIIEQNAHNLLQEEYTINLEALEAFNPDIFSEQDIEQTLYNVIQSLSERCRQIFIMSKIEGKKQKQIAAELNISIHTVETQMGIAYKKLRHFFTTTKPRT